ncbi:MAG: hypothetical protein JNM56_30870 [Planctomycetia bacterium]|nr:hypothetical protein [Planctomycetia bacterium]
MIRRRTQRCALRRRLVVVLALAGYLAGAVGFPLPQFRSAAAEGNPVAVRQHACGCVEVVTQAPPSCCCSKTKAAAPSCCSEAPGEPPAAAEPSESTAGIIWIDSVSARECRGLGTSWLTVEATLPPPALVEWTYCGAADAWLIELTAEPVSQPLLPPTPPPRLSSIV